MGVKAVAWILSISALSTCLTACLISAAVMHWQDHMLFAIIPTAMAMICMVVTVVCFDIARLHPDDTHTLASLVHMYYFVRFISIPNEKRVSAELDHMADECMKSQDDLLMDIIQKNRNTVYHKDYQLNDVKNLKDFKMKHPLTTYAHFESYCERIANGEDNVLTTAKVVYMALSSGTTGKTKKYPLTSDSEKASKTLLTLQSAYCRANFDTGLRKKFLFRMFHPQRVSEGGRLMGGAYQFVLGRNPGDGNVTPEDFLEIFNEGASFYVQAVFALANKETGTLEGFSADLMYSFFNFVIKHKGKICDDIEKGCIHPFPNLPADILVRLNEKMHADPARATELRHILSGSTEGMTRRLWPNMRFVMVASGGGFANSHRLLKNSFLNGLPTGCPVYAGSEGMYGVTDISDSLESGIYTLLPQNAIFEFIPLAEAGTESPTTLFLDEVKLGEKYEIVVSNVNGLLRQRFGDIVEIAGFHKTIPKCRFLYRTGQILTVAFDRTPESIIYEAVKRTEAQWRDRTVNNYTASESFHLEKLLGEVYSPACYVLFVEVAAEKKDVLLTEQQRDVFEVVLCDIHETYREHRDKGSLSPAKIIQVKYGTFAELQEAMQGDRKSMQFKMPRVLRKEPMLKILLQGRLPAR